MDVLYSNEIILAHSCFNVNDWDGSSALILENYVLQRHLPNC